MKEDINKVKSLLDKLIGGQIRRILLNEGFIWPGNPGRVVAVRESWIEYTKGKKVYELGLTNPKGENNWITNDRIIKGPFNYRVIHTNRGRSFGVEVIKGQTYSPEYLGEVEEVRAYSIKVDETEVIGKILFRTNDNFLFRIERRNWSKEIEHEWVKSNFEQDELMMEDDEYKRVY